MKTVVITGASGFVGSNLLSYWEGSNINIITVGRSPIEHVRVQQHLLWDELDQLKELDIDAIIHLAGLAHDVKGSSDAEKYFAVNRDLTIQLYDIFLSSKASKFIFLSSVKAAADKVEDVLKETNTPTPATPYGQSKLEAEKHLLSTDTPEGKDFYILRPCMIHGPGNKGNLNLLFNFVKDGKPYPLGKFKNQRSFLSIENLCFAIENIMNQSTESGIYNVADDDSMSTIEVMRLIAEALNKKPKIMNMPKGLIKVIAKTGDVLPLPINSERLQKLTENYVVDNQKLTKALAKPLPISAKEGMLKTLKSFSN